ncbi:MAG: bifunctional ornithine acetyltransferase/N-acetylglutamate synthase, partial [bacterium]
MDIKKIDGGITAAGGYKAAGLSCGIKKSGKKDLALVYSEVPAVGAAVFTKNHFKAAPVILSIEKMKNETIRAILINSGNANACTGEKGKEDAVNLISLTAEKLNINDDEVHMSSTGIIGEFLPVDIIREGIEEIATMLDISGSSQAAEAIMTTDKVKKEIAYSFKLPSDGITVKVGGMAKGSGMIHPNMATMLGFITTDISITKELLQKALSEVVDHSFNKISVDGDQSTNDSVFLMANAEASNQKITE